MRTLLAFAMLALWAGPAAQASVTLFLSETDFNDAVATDGFAFEGFEDKSTNFDGGAFSGAKFASGKNAGQVIKEGSVGLNTYKINGPLTFTFDQAINAFGVWIMDLGDNAGPTTLNLSTSAGYSKDIFTDFTGPNANQNFLGFVDTENSFTSISFTKNNFKDGVGYDSLRFGLTQAATAPEPGSWLLMLAGFSMIGATLRRRTRAFAKARV